MKKIFIAILLAISIKGASQPVVGRSGSANTVMDSRWMGQYNMFVPRYADTVFANLQKGIDTCGALIFTYDYNGFWYRQCSPKKWVQIFANSPSPSSDTLVWKLSGNAVATRTAAPVLGTTTADNLNFITNNQQRMIIPSAGITRNTAAVNKYLLLDTVTKNLYYGDGGSSSTPTWQQTLTAGSTLTGNNTISGGGFDFTFGDSKEFIIGTTGSSAYFYADASRTGAVSFQRTRPDSIIFAPHLGQLNIDTLRVATNENSLIGWQTSTGRTGYVTIGSGLSLSSGVLSSSGGTPGGSDTYIQFNDGGSFGGDAGFTYNKTTNVFSTNNGAYRPTGTISFSDAGAGSVYRSSSDGLVFRAVTGSGYDLLMYDAAGNGVFGLEAGTSKLGSTSQIGAGLLGYGSWNAWMNLRGGTTTNASLTIRDGVAPSSPAEGQIWRTTDKVYNVIQTGAATKEFTLNDIALTSGRIPYTTTNGRLTDTATFLRSPGGNVGIGTTSPSQLLHVNGIAQIGTAGSTLGQLNISGNTSGTITIKPQAAAGTYNFNLPTTAGTSGYFLTSGGGSGTAMTWTDPTSISLPYWPLAGSSTLTGSVSIDMNGNDFSLTNSSGNGTTFSMTDGGGGSAYFDNTAHAIKVGINTSSPAASAVLDVTSTTGGALMPRMTTTQRDAISSPATGLELFNTTTNSKQIYDGTRWVEAAHPLYKVYTALLSQSGTDAPVATVLENNLGGTVVWTRDDIGQYTATLSGAFTSGKTFFATVPQSVEGPMNFAFILLRNDANSITLSGNVGLDDELDNSVSSIEIRVYY